MCKNKAGQACYQYYSTISGGCGSLLLPLCESPAGLYINTREAEVSLSLTPSHRATTAGETTSTNRSNYLGDKELHTGGKHSLNLEKERYNHRYWGKNFNVSSNCKVSHKKFGYESP